MKGGKKTIKIIITIFLTGRFGSDKKPHLIWTATFERREIIVSIYLQMEKLVTMLTKKNYAIGRWYCKSLQRSQSVTFQKGTKTTMLVTTMVQKATPGHTPRKNP